MLNVYSPAARRKMKKKKVRGLRIGRGTKVNGFVFQTRPKYITNKNYFISHQYLELVATVYLKFKTSCESPTDIPWFHFPSAENIPGSHELTQCFIQF